MQKVIISVLGHDRPGIIAAVSRTLFEEDGNIENVAQTILQSEFAGIFIVSIPEAVSANDLCCKLREKLAPMDLTVHIKPMTEAPAPSLPVPHEPFVITTRGMDRKGLVANFTAIIARYGVNVTNLQAVFKGGDDPSDNIMIYEVDIPDDIDQQALYGELRQKGEELGQEISIQHRDIFHAINRI